MQGIGLSAIPRRHTRLGYVLAFIMVLVAAALRYWARKFLPEAPFLFFFLAMMITAWIGGLGPGVAATILSTIIGKYLFIEPIHSLKLAHASQSFLLLYFAFQGILCSALFEAVLRTAERSAATAEALRNTLSERDAVEQARRESEARFEGIVKNAVDGIITIDERGLIESFNPAAERQFGYSREEVLGKNVTLLVPAPFNDQDSQSPRADLAKTVGVGREVIGLRKDSSTFPMDLSVSEIQLRGRRTFIGIVHDITERKLAEQQLLRGKEAAEAANKDKDQFLAMISHELRTPLTAILGWSELLKTDASDAAELKQGIETIARNARVQSRLIEDLLDISRMISGKLRLEVRPAKLQGVVDAAIDSMRHAADAKKIMLRRVGDTSDFYVNADAGRLQQVVWNLLSNAIKFTPAHGTVDVRVERDDANALITVSDSGPGIDPDFLPQIFNRFHQADSSSTRKHGGLGLGLSIARNLVEMHGGTIAARNATQGSGAIFTVQIPIVSHASADGDGQKLVDPPKTDLRIAPVDRALDGLRVLVVDDEADALELIARVLRRSGAVVTAVRTAADALESIRTSKPDVLLSDLAMPDEDGYSLIRKVRQMSPPHQDIPAAALTAFARPEDSSRALSAGFQVHVAKPIEPAELTAVVADLAGRPSNKGVTSAAQA